VRQNIEIKDVTSERLVEICARDSEFMLLARYWSGGFALKIGERTAAALSLRADELSAGEQEGPGWVSISGAEPVWEKVLSAIPPRGFNDVYFAIGNGLVPSGDILVFSQYYPAIQRAVQLLREELHGAQPTPDENASARRSGHFDSPVGRYVHIEVDGQDYRLYFEEAGTGIPLLLQHTAGSHGSQWRHLFETPEITEHFRLIAYDLPFHGKSLPPDGPRWWASRYRLTQQFAMAVPLALNAALGLERPVFMGCSVGGLLALDLARYHPESFRAVISLEPALKVAGNLDAVATFWHPQVSNEFKARLMLGLMSPTSPEARRMETMFGYSAGWPPAFLGDLHYYVEDHDLTQEAQNIDTSRIPVYLLTGEYDNSATIEHGAAAHEAIKGSSFDVMYGLGHFPMSEDPEAFNQHILPILDKIRGAE
jgi:pimeloyl-ACP methyl ester carboxylesterase